MIWAARRWYRAASLGVVLVLLATGCSGGDDPSAGAPSESYAEPSDAPTLEAEPVISSGTIVGRLPRADRRRAERAVAAVTVRWLEAAYLGGDYPRRSFRNSFPGFTPGARAAARRDARLMTNQAVGRRIDGVAPGAIRVRVDLLAVGKRAVTGTAHVVTRFATEGDIERTYRVAGRLMMTRREGGWKVFAYDMTRARIAPPDRSAQRPRNQRNQNGGRA